MGAEFYCGRSPAHQSATRPPHVPPLVLASPAGEGVGVSPSPPPPERIALALSSAALLLFSLSSPRGSPLRGN